MSREWYAGTECPPWIDEDHPHGFWCDCPHCEPARCERCRASVCDEPGCPCLFDPAVPGGDGFNYCSLDCALAALLEVVTEYGCGAWFWYIDKDGGTIDASD